MHVISSILLAQTNRGESFREGFRSRGTTGHDDVLLGLLIVVTIIAGMWAVSRLVNLRRRRRGYNNPWRLFWALCKAHRLSWSDSWLLRRVAREQNLHAPGRLFLEAERWEEKHLGPRFTLEYSRLKALRTQILGETKQSSVSEPVVRSTRSTGRPGPAAPTRAPGKPGLPLFPSLPSPTLDVPPWTVER